MHIENLKIFSDLVESQSFSKSAKMNGITQSAVSQQLRSMEKHFNILIIDRSQKQFRLTREGQKLYETSKEILHLTEKLDSELQELKKVVSGTIHLSTIYSIGLHELPPYIKRFLQQFPSVNVRVEYRRSNLIYEDITSNSVDLGLVAFPTPMKNLEIVPFQEDELVLICHPTHPLAHLSTVTIEEVAAQKFIGFDPDIPTRKAVDLIFREHKLEVDPVMDFDNIETVKRAVEIDAGVAIVPKGTVSQEVAQGTLVAVHLKGRQYKRPLAILYRKGRPLTPAIKKFIELLCSDLDSRGLSRRKRKVDGGGGRLSASVVGG